MARIAEMTIKNGHTTVQVRVHMYDFCVLRPSDQVIISTPQTRELNRELTLPSEIALMAATEPTAIEIPP